MNGPDLSATVPPDTRVRLTYSLVWQVLTGGTPDALVQAINDAWYANTQAVVLSPSTDPIAGPDLEWGLQHSGATTIDLKTAHNLPTVTWDVWLANYRSITSGILNLGDNAQLVETDYLPAAGTAAANSAAQPGARTATAGANAGSASAASPLTQFQTWVSTLTGRLILIVVVILAVVLGVKYGPQVVALFKARKGKE